MGEKYLFILPFLWSVSVPGENGYLSILALDDPNWNSMANIAIHFQFLKVLPV